MPLTTKGQSILRRLVAHYGTTKGTRVFYASINAGRLKGVEKGR